MFDFPELIIVPISKLLPHETYDKRRVKPLINRLILDNCLRNPPIVAATSNNKQFVVLDGMNRISAFKELGINYIVVQQVQTEDPNNYILSWNHLIWGLKKRKLLDSILKINGIQETGDDDWNKIANNRIILRLPNMTTINLTISTNEVTQAVRILNAIVNTYKAEAYYMRTNQYQIELFQNEMPDLTALIVYPKFDIQSVIRVATNKCLFPSGITRFVIIPRVLNINYPMEILANKSLALQQQNKYLHKWIKERLIKGKVRYYEESTFIFDEY